MEYTLIPRSSRVRPGSQVAIKSFDPIGVVVHQNGDPGASLLRTYNWMSEVSKDASAHIFVHRFQAHTMIPLNEIVYHSGKLDVPIHKQAWFRFHGVEMLEEDDGSIHPETISATISVVADLVNQFGYSVANVYRHNDITGKECPIHFVQNPFAWGEFKRLVLVVSRIRENNALTSLHKGVTNVEPLHLWNANHGQNVVRYPVAKAPSA